VKSGSRLGLLNSEKACAVEVDKMASIGEKSVDRMNRVGVCLRAAWCDILFKLSPEVNVETVGSRQ
jgi:hypothetical protein